LIEKHLDAAQFEYQIFWWNEVHKLTTEISNFVQNKGDVAVAVGGDGTVNLMAKELVNSDTALAIVPMGSGNGLARELGLSLNAAHAIRAINTAQMGIMDVGFLNGNQFANVAGWGFDAQVSKAFAQIKKRGLWSYVKAISSEFRKAKNYSFEIKQGDDIIQKKAFMLTAANGTQWGNNFFVAPDASYSDGWLDIVFLKKPKLRQIPGLVWSLYRRKGNKLVSQIRLKEAVITCDQSIYTHLDGEPSALCNRIELTIKESALHVMI